MRRNFWKASLGVGTLVLLGTGAFLWGFLSHRNKTFPYEHVVRIRRWLQEEGQGRWTSRSGPEHAGATETLLALPYLQGYRTAPARAGVVVHDRERAFPGVNLYNAGHAPAAHLIDMDGALLHTWSLPIDAVWKDHPPVRGSEHWRRVHPFPDGDLLAIFEGIGLVKLDRESRLLWAHRGREHHDLFVEPGSGRIYTLTREQKTIPRLNPDEPVVEDFVTVLDADGREVRRISIVEAIERSRWAPLLRRGRPEGDFLHTNAIEVLDGSLAERSPLFRKGRLLISIRQLDTVAILDPEREEVVWALTGPWRWQHEPALLPNGRLLVFDNQGARGASRVLELDPFTQQVTWDYGGRDGEEFRSDELGACQRLPNGNTLVTDSESGRAFEVTPDRRVVWEFLNPHRAGANGELIAALFEVLRLPPGFRFDG